MLLFEVSLVCYYFLCRLKRLFHIHKNCEFHPHIRIPTGHNPLNVSGQENSRRIPFDFGVSPWFSRILFCRIVSKIKICAGRDEGFSGSCHHHLSGKCGLQLQLPNYRLPATDCYQSQWHSTKTFCQNNGGGCYCTQSGSVDLSLSNRKTEKSNFRCNSCTNEGLELTRRNHEKMEKRISISV